MPKNNVVPIHNPDDLPGDEVRLGPPPEKLSKLQKDEWWHIRAQAPWLTLADTMVVHEFVYLRRQARKAKKGIAKHGAVLEHPKSEALYMSPWVRYWKDLQADMLKYYRELGLTPNARNGLM